MSIPDALDRYCSYLFTHGGPWPGRRRSNAARRACGLFEAGGILEYMVEGKTGYSYPRDESLSWPKADTPVSERRGSFRG